MSQSAIETLIKLNSQTQGRDRIIRLLQYGSKFIWWYLEKGRKDPLWIVRIKDLEYSLSTARKIFRLGRFLDTLNAALKSLHLQELSLRTTITFSKISSALYLLTDHIIWFGRVGLMAVDKSKWTQQSNKFWLLSITFSLIRDLMELWHVLETQKNPKRPISSPMLKCLRDRKDLTIDTVKNCCDVFIPATNLGFCNLSPGTIGLLGVVSSALGIITLIDPMLKLQPN
uniref:Peroxisomal membrane protein 11B n=1 Tax=Strigamia maritima TaxID=126957 RepID=T1JI86_STRMM